MRDEPIDDSGQPQEDDVNPSSTQDLEAFAARLSTFEALSVSLDRDAILFAAGQASCEPIKRQRQPLRGYRVWQGATVAMSLLSVTLGSMLAMQPAVEPKIIIVERRASPHADQVGISPATDTVAMPQAVAMQPPEITDLNQAEDKQLADAWKTRREMIAAGEQLERQLASALPGLGPKASEQSLTRSSLLGAQSQDTIQRWLKEQL